MFNLTETDIRQIVNEAMDELTRKGQSVPTAAVNVPNAAAPKNDKFIGKPICTSAFYSKPDNNGQEYMTVRIAQIHDVHKNALMQEWAKKYGQIFTARVNQNQKVGTAQAPIDLIIAPGQEDTFVQIVPNLVQDIANLSGAVKAGGIAATYDANYLKNLQLSIIGRMDEAPSEADMEKAQARQSQNVKSIMMKLSDPDFVKKLGFVGGVSTSSYSNLKDIVKQGNSTGWRISPLNQLMVLSYLPNATFVTNAWTWEHVFNREVVDNTQFALEVKVANDKPKDINSRIQAAGQLGYIDKNNAAKNPWDVYRSLKSNLSQAQQIAVEFLSNILNPHDAHFIKQKVYDVSNTRLIPGMPDVWNDEVNFADNIKGIPNAKAMEYLQGSEESGTTQPTQAPQWAPRGEEEIGDIINILSALCTKYCGTTPNAVPGGSLGDTIAHFGEFYAKNYVCRNRNIVKPANIAATCNAFAIGLAAVYGFSVQNKGNQLSAAMKDPNFENNLNDLYQDFMDLVSEINVELLKLSSARRKKNKVAGKSQVMEENINESTFGKPISFQEFAQLCGYGEEIMEEGEEDMDGDINVENLQESFFKMLDKMERING